MMTAACELRGPVDDGFGKFGFGCHLYEGLTNQERFLHGFEVVGKAMVNWPADDFFDFGIGDGNICVSTVEDHLDARHGLFIFFPEFE